MSALSEINASQIAAAAQEKDAASITIPPAVVAAVKTEINSLFWNWYKEHENDHVVTVHFWLFSKDVKVSDLHNVFVLLFGGEGEDQSVERPPSTIPPEPAQ